jgi:hypothetical protein
MEDLEVPDHPLLLVEPALLETASMALDHLHLVAVKELEL